MIKFSADELERRRLIALAQSGDLSARNTVAEDNKRLILKALVKVKVGEALLEKDDLYSFGYDGLLYAIANFKLDRGIRFSTFAMSCIIWHMIRGLQIEGKLIYIPVHAQEALTTLNRANGESMAETGNELDPEEAAEIVGVSVETARLYISMSRPLIPLDGKYSDTNSQEDTDTHLSDMIPDDSDSYKQAEITTILQEALDSLDERSRYIVKELDLLGKTLQEVALQLEAETTKKISRERVRSIRKEALAHMRVYIKLKLKQPTSDAAYDLVMA